MLTTVGNRRGPESLCIGLTVVVREKTLVVALVVCSVEKKQNSLSNCELLVLVLSINVEKTTPFTFGLAVWFIVIPTLKKVSKTNTPRRVSRGNLLPCKANE
jgi:hypothetical protein